MKIVDYLSEWRGTIFVAVYSWISLLSQLLLHWQIDTRKRNTYILFKDKLSQEKLVFVSSLDCKMNYKNALFHGIWGGLITFIAVFLVSYYFMREPKYQESDKRKPEFLEYTRRTRKFHPIAYLSSATYFLILISAFLKVDPHGFLPYVDVIYGLIIAGIIGASLVTTCTYRRTDYPFKNNCIAKEYWEMVHSSSMQFFHTTVWASITILFVFGAGMMAYGYLQFPLEIAYSTQYRTVLVCWVFLTFIPILGAGFGIVMPALDGAALARNKVAALDFEK